MSLGGLVDAVDGLVAAGASSMSDCESIAELHRQLARLDAVVTLAAAKFDADRNFEGSGAQTAAAWLATVCHLPKGAARHRVALGRRLRHLPRCEEAWVAGEITGSHVAVIAGKRRDATADLLARDEALLVENARSMRFELFVKTVDYWDQRAHPDGAEDQDRDRQDRRDVYVAESFKGMWLGKITLDPIRGTIVADELHRREQALFTADWADAKDRLGREPTLADLQRTPAQRRADALVEMAVRSQTAPADGIRPAPLFTVYVGYETMHGRICELAGGTVLSPGALVPWLDQAFLERAVFRSPTRVEIGVTQRLFRGATRRAVIIRDRQCTHEFCDQPAERCEIDHVIPYARGGPTTQENGDLRCGFHNRLKEKRPPLNPRAAPTSSD